MSFNLASLSNKAALKAPRIVLLGVEKIGKTTFACGSRVEDGHIAEVGLNAPVVISVKGEEGADEFNVPKFPVAQSFDEVMDAVGSLYAEDHEMRTVVLDSASALEPLVWDKLCRDNNANSIEKVGGGYGKGYTEALTVWRGLLDGLDALRDKKNMSSIIIGHVKVKAVNNPDTDAYDAYQMDINDKAANLLYRWADLILFCNVKVVVRKEDTGFGEKARAVDASAGQRFLYTAKRPSHPGGGRGVYGRLPYELPLDWAAFQEAVTNVCNQ
jgi:hypothetical protein